MHEPVSVIIPTYNRAYCLRRALDSVKTQSHPAAEIIVVDDGSTDETRELVSRYAPSVTYLYIENQGVSAARNHGIEHARSPWLAFLDSDDRWLAPKIERQLGAIAAEPHHRLCHTDEIWIRRGQRVNPMKKHTKTGGWIFERCLPMCRISPSSVMIHRSLFDEVGLFDISLPACEDYDLWLRITAHHPVLYINERLLEKFGGHDDQLSHQHWGMDRFRIASLEKLLADQAINPQQRQAVLNMLQEKLSILVNGARKRGREHDMGTYEQRLNALKSQLTGQTTVAPQEARQ